MSAGPVTVLDLDLDFFVHDVAHWRDSTDERLNADAFRPWAVNDALYFLQGRCALDRRLPGIVVDHHADVFRSWRDAIEARALVPPFDVTHVDAHADLGLGDTGYIYLLTEFLFASPDARPRLAGLDDELTDGNWLSFAVACGWVSRLTYVYNTDGERPADLMVPVLKGWNRDATSIQLAALNKSELDRAFLSADPPDAVFVEDAVPFAYVPWKSFEARGPFDLICLTRSPGFTPLEADEIFDVIRERFVDESAFAG